MLRIYSNGALKINGELQAQNTMIEVEYLDSDEMVFLLGGFGKKVAPDPQGRYMRVSWDQLIPSAAPPVGSPSFTQATGMFAKPLDFIKKYLSSDQVNVSVVFIGREDKIDGINGQIAAPRFKFGVGQNAMYSLSWIGEAPEPSTDALQLLVFV